MPGLGRYFNRIIKKIIDSDYGDAVAGEVQATCAIGSVVDLQNLPGTTLVLRVVFNFVAGLAVSCVRNCWPQPCPVQDKIIYVWDVQRRWLAIKAEKEEETTSYRSCPRVARQQQFEDWFADD